MTLKEYNDIRNHIIGEYEYALYRKSQAEVRGLEWTGRMKPIIRNGVPAANVFLIGKSE